MFAQAYRENRHTGILEAALFGFRGRLADMLRHLSGLGPADRLKPLQLRKFLRLVNEVALIKNEENIILSRIEHLERRHNALRGAKRLKKFTPAGRAANSNALVRGSCNEHPNRDSNPIIKIAFLWWLCDAGKRNQKKQSLTAD